jgi:hypothetical protein
MVAVTLHVKLQTAFQSCQLFCASKQFVTKKLPSVLRCWRYHHAAGGITTLLTISPRCWRYHHAAGGITTLLAVSPRC